MIILGISNTKDSGACLLIDGNLVAAVNEERLTGVKLTRAFPRKSIDWLLRRFDIRRDRIDRIALGAWKGIDSWTSFPGYVSRVIEAVVARPEAAGSILSRLQGSVESDSRQYADFKSGIADLGFENIPIEHCHHHFAHAAAAFEFSPFDESLVVTLDGRGDFMSGSVSVWRRGKKPEILRTETELDSFGAFYGWITHLLGFTPDRHEGKVTGLAARGNPSECLKILESMIDVVDGKICAKLGEHYAPYMRADMPLIRNQLSKFQREDIAAAAQALLERLVCRYIEFYLVRTGQKRLCLAGGIFANVLLNMRLRAFVPAGSLFVFPHMGDGGIAAGAVAAAARRNGEGVTPLNGCYLGPEFTESECLAAIRMFGFAEVRPENLARDVAHLIEAGKVVGIFQGRMEYGPRALGNRSIVARATDVTINETLNVRLNRSEFMPFAPVSLIEDAAGLYADWDIAELCSQSMTSCYVCKPLMKTQSPAAVHLDGTARPQIIHRMHNPFYFDVIKEYKQLSGIGTVINTSFNEHEAPIVCKPEQAIGVLSQNGVDAVAMPPFLVLPK